MLAGLTASVGTVGDAYDNALAETTIGLYKTESTRAGSPFRNGPVRTLADLEDITSAWVSWYNTSRLMHRLGRRPPAEAEAEYHARSRHLAAWLDMGPSRRTASSPSGRSGSRSGPPPGKATALRPMSSHALARAGQGPVTSPQQRTTRPGCSHKNRCARNPGCSRPR